MAPSGQSSMNTAANGLAACDSTGKRDKRLSKTARGSWTIHQDSFVTENNIHLHRDESFNSP